MLYYLEYNSGKDCFYIDKDGKILVTKDKANIRNTSRLHWIWWKIDGLTDKYTGIYYLTDPDKDIIDFIDDMICQ